MFLISFIFVFVLEGDSFVASLSRFLTKLISFAVYASIIYGMIKLFNLRINSKKYSIESKVGTYLI